MTVYLYDQRACESLLRYAHLSAWGCRHMRKLLVALVLLAWACPSPGGQPEQKIAIKGSAVDPYRWPDKQAVLSGEDASLTYAAPLSGNDTDGKPVKPLDVTPDYVLSVYGGQLLGGDRGEWGGELLFRDKAGGIHRLLEHNVVGIVPASFGVVVFTGLNHLSVSTGAIYVVNLGKDQLPHATLLYDLQGAPKDIEWTVDNELVFTVQPGLRSKADFSAMPAPVCHLLDKRATLSTVACADIAQP
jgi:hypothetical protein